LKILTLHENAALSLPRDLLGPTYIEVGIGDKTATKPQAILDYYFAQQSQGAAAMQEVRLLMVGRGRVGKTSLLNVLRGETFNQKEGETPGITVLPLDLTCKQGTARAHAWDFGGQEFLHGTHQIFLSERCVYVLVLEGREGNWEVETDYWLRFIQSYGGDSPVIVALNKHDEHAFSVDRFRLQERCPQIVGFVETDAFTRRGIPELRALLEHTVNDMKDVWLGVPKKWHRIKEALTAMPQSFVCYADYQALCAREGVTEDRQQGSLAETLHRLGIALNFRDHHRLRHTSVLKPQWVTEGIYGLLRYAQSQECHGVLEQAMIAMALPVKDYPPETHEFVMELMEKFEVAFPLESADKQAKPTRWLIPELLPEVQPAPFVEFRAVDVKRLRFSYPEALPPGLLPRLIVRTHEMSAAHPDWRWRGGVVLEWNGCQALVRLDRPQRQTTVEVIDSPPDTQQSLFDLVRSELEVLHGKVRVVEEVELPGHPGSWVSAGKLRLLERHHTSETLEETKEKELTMVQVTPTLNSVESQEARDASQPNAPKRMRLFVSYAHDDVRKLKPLGTHLKILGRRGYIQVWDDKQLVAGEEWEERIMTELSQAEIVLMIYSTASRASDFIQDKEGPMAVKLSQGKACRLIVVPLDRKDWDDHAPLEQELKKLQAASWNAKPVLEFTPQTKGWQEVEQAIQKVVLNLRDLSRQPELSGPH
jgi:internalin A